MTNQAQILCPWCGAEMTMVSNWAEWNDEFVAHTRCWNCQSNGPTARARNEIQAKKGAIAAAMRRYTSQIKPMTLKEVKETKAVWIEDPEEEYESKLYPAIYWGIGNGAYSVFVADIDDGEERAWYPNEGYGGWWRCWERKPTDEERSAAEWET